MADNRFLAFGARCAQAFEQPGAADHQSRESPPLAFALDAQLADPAQAFTGLGGHRCPEQVRRANHDLGSLAIVRAERSSPWARPSSRAGARRLMAAPMSSTSDHGTRMRVSPMTGVPNTRSPSRRSRRGSRRAQLPRPLRIELTYAGPPASPSNSTSSTRPQRRP